MTDPIRKTASGRDEATPALTGVTIMIGAVAALLILWYALK